MQGMRVAAEPPFRTSLCYRVHHDTEWHRLKGSGVEIFSSPENFGADPPTGSASQNFTTMTNLYDGTGDPWAGQERLVGCFEAFFIVPPFSSPENLGTEPPTGSKRKQMCQLTDLYDGTGDPWAGQERLNGSFEAFFREKLVSSPLNFGADPPTGSEMAQLE